MRPSLLFLALFWVVGCPFGKKADPRIGTLKASLEKMQQELAEYEPKIKKAESNLGLRNQLIEEREALKSRIARQLFNLKQLDPTAVPPTEGGEAHH